MSTPVNSPIPSSSRSAKALLLKRFIASEKENESDEQVQTVVKKYQAQDSAIDVLELRVKELCTEQTQMSNKLMLQELKNTKIQQELQVQIEELNNVLLAKTNENAELKSQLCKLSKTPTNREQENAQAEIEQLTAEILEISAENSKLKQQNSEYLTRVEQLKNELTHLEALAADNQMLEEKLEELEQINTEQQLLLHQLQDQIETSSNLVDATTNMAVATSLDVELDKPRFIEKTPVKLVLPTVHRGISPHLLRQTMFLETSAGMGDWQLSSVLAEIYDFFVPSSS